VQAKAKEQIPRLLQSALVALCAGKSGSESPRDVCPMHKEEQRLNTLPAPVSLIFTRALYSL